MSIPETFSYIDLDGQTRTEPLRLMPNGRVTPLTPAVVAALPLEQLEAERAHYLSRSLLSGADLRMLGYITRRIDELLAEANGLEQELAEAVAARDALYTALQPFNESLERGDGWYAQAHRVRHDQLLRRLELAEARVWAAKDALSARAAAKIA